MRKTRSEKVADLLQILPTRGAKAFPELIHALVMTHQEFIAKTLDPVLTRHFQEAEERDPDEHMVVDAAAARSAVKEIPVEEKVSEIRTLLLHHHACICLVCWRNWSHSIHIIELHFVLSM